MTSHAGHAHPNTSAARAACRSLAARGIDPPHPAHDLPGSDSAAKQAKIRRTVKAKKQERFASTSECSKGTKGCTIDHRFAVRCGTTPPKTPKGDRPETNPGCQHGLRFAPRTCTSCPPQRKESDPCDRGTPGCSSHHTELDSECETW